MNFDISLSEAVVWLVMGLLAGSVAGAVVTREKKGFGLVVNLVFGLIGAFIGGALFDALDVDVGLGKLTIDLNRLVAAIVGAVIVVFGATFLHKQRQKDK